MKSKKLSLSFYLQKDVARLLLGKKLYSKVGKEPITGGIIVETESYEGTQDRACHAFGGKKTKRNSVMYEEGGVAYIYLCYGIHHLLNVVTNRKNIPHAVLIRAIEPTTGIGTILKRRKKEKMNRSLTAGPGALTQALGINKNFNGISFLSSQLWIEEGEDVSQQDITASPRIGVAYAGKDALLPLRFRITKSKWTSLAK